MRRTTHIIAALAAALGIAGSTMPARASMPAAIGDLLIILQVGGVPPGFLAVSPATGHTMHILPVGLFDRTGRTLFTATPAAHNSTLVRAIDVRSGHTLRSLIVPGIYSTALGDYGLLTHSGTPPASLPTLSSQGRVPSAPLLRPAPQTHAAPASPGHTALIAVRASAGEGIFADAASGLSALSWNGRWLALRGNADTARTDIALIDTRRMRLASSLDLRGTLTLDAISGDGAWLYLIEPLPRYGQQAYQVRLASTQHGVLLPRPLRVAGERPGAMSGISWTRAWSHDGAMLYTLYITPNRGAFIHALGVESRQVRCIDLPNLRQTYWKMVHATLSVASDGRALYVVDPWIGEAIVVGLAAGSAAPRSVRLSSSAGSPFEPQVASALSADGRSVFEATNHGIWRVSTTTLAVQARLLPGLPFSSIALSRDGRHLCAVRLDHPVVSVLDAANGRLLGFTVLAPGFWAIEQAMVGLPAPI